MSTFYKDGEAPKSPKGKMIEEYKNENDKMTVSPNKKTAPTEGRIEPTDHEEKLPEKVPEIDTNEAFKKISDQLNKMKFEPEVNDRRPIAERAPAPKRVGKFNYERAKDFLFKKYEESELPKLPQEKKSTMQVEKIQLEEGENKDKTPGLGPK